MPKGETEPITDDEWRLRRVWRDRFGPPVSPNAFEPRTKGRDIDTTGISLYRKACLESLEEILSTITTDKQPHYGIVQVPVALIKCLNLTVVIEPDERVLGHVVIPELNATAYQADKGKFTATKRPLRTLPASRRTCTVGPIHRPDSPIMGFSTIRRDGSVSRVLLRAGEQS